MNVKIKRVLIKILTKLKRCKDLTVNKIYEIYILWKPFNIMTAPETIRYIIDKKCSVARFGDGELSIAAYGSAIKFQKSDSRLQEALCNVIRSKNEELLLCIVNRINMVGKKRKVLQNFWQEALKINLYNWTKNFDKKRLYGDASFTRLADCNGYDEQYAQILEIKKIWNGRTVVIVEGDKTRFGVGNDLLDNVESIYRVLAPARDAFDYYEELLAVILRIVEAIYKESLDVLVLLALGPTATVLAYELAEKKIQAVDIGHLDICYEWLKQGNFDAIPGKYTNEAPKGGGEC